MHTVAWLGLNALPLRALMASAEDPGSVLSTGLIINSEYVISTHLEKPEEKVSIEELSG